MIPTLRVDPMACRVDQVYEGILDVARRNRRTGENLLETLERMAVNEALALFGGRQAHAADHLGLTRRQMNDHARNLCIRPTDAGTLPTNWNRRGPKGKKAA